MHIYIFHFCCDSSSFATTRQDVMLKYMSTSFLRTKAFSCSCSCAGAQACSTGPMLAHQLFGVTAMIHTDVQGNIQFISKVQGADAQEYVLCFHFAGPIKLVVATFFTLFYYYFLIAVHQHLTCFVLFLCFILFLNFGPCFSDFIFCSVIWDKRGLDLVQKLLFETCLFCTHEN